MSATLAALALLGCNSSAPIPYPEEVAIDPEELVACCDPEAMFPQEVGAVEVDNGNKTGVSVAQTGHEERGVEVDFDSTASITLVVDECGDQDLELTVDTEPPATFVVRFDDRCPVRTGDPDDGLSQPALDLLHCDAAHDADDGPWVDCETAGDWPPDSLLYSWFMTVALSAGGTQYECTVQRHDGVDSELCAMGDVGDVTIWFTEQGAVMRFPTGRADDYTAETGYMETPSSTFFSDSLVGTFDPASGPIDPPQP